MLPFDEALQHKNPQLGALTAADPKMKSCGDEMGGTGWCYNSLVMGFVKG